MEQNPLSTSPITGIQKLRVAVVIGALATLLVAATPGGAAASGRDSDHDGLTNRFERLYSATDPRDKDSDNDGVRDGKENPDHDGLTNRMEQRLHTDPRDKDSDNDGVRDSRDDQDCDGVSNLAEIRAGLNPRDADSDHDGIDDGHEDANHDGVLDADEDGDHGDPSCDVDDDDPNHD